MDGGERYASSRVILARQSTFSRCSRCRITHKSSPHFHLVTATGVPRGQIVLEGRTIPANHSDAAVSSDYSPANCEPHLTDLWRIFVSDGLPSGAPPLTSGFAMTGDRPSGRRPCLVAESCSGEGGESARRDVAPTLRIGTSKTDRAPSR